MNLSPRHRLAIELAVTRASELPSEELADCHSYKGEQWLSIMSVNR